MKISQSQINELWKLKAKIYGQKTPKIFWESFLIPSVILLIPFCLFEDKRQIGMFYALSYGLFLLSTMMIIHQIKLIKNQHFRTRYSYPLTILCYNIYEISILTLTCAATWTTAIYIFEQKLLIHITGYFLVAFFVIVIITLLLSHRVKSLNRPNKLNKYLPIVLSFSGAAPGSGLLIYAISSHSAKIEVAYYVLLFLSIFTSVLLLPITVLALHEILLLGLGRWPEIKKSGREFVISESEGQDTTNI
jgi:hypothetical protein